MDNQLRVFCDCETTGLNPALHEIISIAFIVTVGNKELTRWKLKITPKKIENADPQALIINGYNAEEWKNSIDIKDALLPIADLFSKPIIFIGYNPGFDMSFIRTALEAHGYYLRRLRMVDVMTLVHEHLYKQGLNKMSLDSVRSYLGIITDDAHTAMQDVIDTKLVYDKLSRCSWLNRLWWRIRFKLQQIKK